MPNSLFYDCLHYLLPFRHGGPVNKAGEEVQSVTDLMYCLINYNGVCRAAPGKASGSAENYEYIAPLNITLSTLGTELDHDFCYR